MLPFPAPTCTSLPQQKNKMQVSHLTLSLAAALTAHASPLLHSRADYNIAQIRLWSAPGCPGGTDNQGEWTVHNETGEINTCLALPASAAADDGRALRYLSIEEQYASSDPAWANCTTTLYTDAACAVGATVLALEVCADAPAEAAEGWGSFEVAC